MGEEYEGIMIVGDELSEASDELSIMGEETPMVISPQKKATPSQEIR